MHTLFAAPLRFVLLKIGITNAVVYVTMGLGISFVGPIVAAWIMKKTQWLEFSYIRINSWIVQFEKAINKKSKEIINTYYYEPSISYFKNFLPIGILDFLKSYIQHRITFYSQTGTLITQNSKLHYP